MSYFVFPIEEKSGPLVTMHACWVADNGFETSVWATRDEALEFCRKRGRSEPRVLSSQAEYDRILRAAYQKVRNEK